MFITNVLKVNYQGVQSMHVIKAIEAFLVQEGSIAVLC